MSGIPPELLPITGWPHAVPSITTKPKGSFLDGIKETVAKFWSFLITSWPFLPTKWVLSNPNSFACFFNFSSKLPDPTIIVNGFFPCFLNSSSYNLFAVSIESIPLKSANFPTNRIKSEKSVGILPSSVILDCNSANTSSLSTSLSI